MEKMSNRDNVYSKVIITKGSEGAYIKKTEQLIPAFPCTPVDPTGAGDAFVAGFTYALSEGQNLSEAVEFANAVAAISTEKVGAQSSLPTLQQVLRRMQRKNT
jgi:ribokinase